jgi:large subunit ribosomal protein L35Ae
LLHIQNCQDLKGAQWYLGKRVAFITKAHKIVNNTKFRVHWGKIVTTHGHNGVVRAKFLKNLPPQAMGSVVRVMLYPNKTI